MSLADIQREMDSAKNAFQIGRDLLKKHKDNMTNEIKARVDQAFDDAETYKANADRFKREQDLKKWEEDPIRKHGQSGPSDDGKVSQAEYAKSLGLKKAKLTPEQSQMSYEYIEKGKMALSPETQKGLSTISDPDGGFISPEEMRAEMITKRRNLSFIRSRATVFETSSGIVTFPSFDFDGVVSKPKQNETIPETGIDNIFDKQQFMAHKYAVIFPIPMELLEDGVPNIQDVMTTHFATRFGEVEEQDFLNGDGNGEPLGLLQASLPTVSAGTADQFNPDDIHETVYSIKAQYRAGSAWMMHRDNVKRVRQMKGSDNNYLWQIGLQAGEPATLDGYPILESEWFPNTAPNADPGTDLALFGDFRWYWIVDRIGFMVQRLDELYAAKDQIGLKMRQRTDGAPVLREPFIRLVTK